MCASNMYELSAIPHMKIVNEFENRPKNPHTVQYHHQAISNYLCFIPVMCAKTD